MRLSLKATDTEVDVQVSAADETVTIGDLFQAAGLSCELAALDADGYRCDPSTPLSALDLADGSVLVSPHSPSVGQGAEVAEMVCVAGPGTGRTFRFEAGTFDLCVVAPEDIRSASALFRLEIGRNGTVEVAGLSGGTAVFVDGQRATETLRPGSWVTVDGSVFRIAPIEPGRTRATARAGGRSAFVRPPRVIEPPVSEPVLIPKPPAEPRPPEPLSLLLLLMPIPAGIIMATLTKSPFYLIFTLLSPIMTVGRSVDGKRKMRKAKIENAEIWAADLAEFNEQLARRQAHAAEQAREARPDLGRLAEIARNGDPEMWRSRAGHPDFLRPVIGAGTTRWEPELIGNLSTPELQRAAEAGSQLPMTPVAANLLDGLAIGIIGPPIARRRLAAAVMSHLAVEHGPGDVEIAVLVSEESAPHWDFLKWLPHLVDESGSLRVATSIDDADRLANRTMPEPETNVYRPASKDLETPIPVFLVDSEPMVRAGVRPLASRFPRLSGRAVVLADTVDDLPAFCTSFVEIARDGSVSLTDVQRGRTTRGIIGAYAEERTSAEICRSLARFTDPESKTSVAQLPDFTKLKDILGIEHSTDALVESWADPPKGCRSLLGVAEHGPLHVEFLRDGPHALVAGTTGAGKSELLRSMIVSLAANYGPDKVTFVLVDFKGGGAFDVFQDLPHNVGVVTDLDEHLSGRALRCLQAELKYREHRLRDAGVSDLRDLPESDDPLPRLLIVVDEFATLAAELPDFLNSLVDVAQRGRSLGIHMVLATQRPTGVVDAKIRANTNLRIALRVQDDADSIDVIGARSAADIDRRHPGRAFARFGASELVGFQTALVTIESQEKAGPALHLDTFGLLARSTPTGDEPVFDGDGPDDLDNYVIAARGAATSLGIPDPRVPWPDPLPASLSAEALVAGANAAAQEADGTDADDATADGTADHRRWSAPFGLLDLPDEQCQRPAWWSGEDGNVIAYGIEPGAATAAVTTIVLGLAGSHDADGFHIYVIDFAGSLSPLRALPHTGGYVSGDDDERLLRTLQLVEAELDRRRRLVEEAQIPRIDADTRLDEPTPLTAVVIANYGAVLELFEEIGELGGPGRLAQIVRDGPSLGVFVFVASTSERDVPNRVAQQVETKLVLRMADPNSYMMFGLKTREVPELVPGRAIDIRTKTELQIAHYGGSDLRSWMEGRTWAAGRRGPAKVEVLEDEIPFDAVRHHSSVTTSSWHLSLGIGHGDLKPVGIDLRLGRHAVIIGPSGSGKTTALKTLAAAARASDPDAVIALATARREEWADLESPLGLTDIDYLLSDESDDAKGRRALILIDGHESATVPTEVLDQVTAQPMEGIHVVVTGRGESFRTPDAWLRAVVSHRSGIAINATPDNGDMFRCRFPSPKGLVPPGRAYVVNEGIPSLAQIALPTSPARR